MVGKWFCLMNHHNSWIKRISLISISLWLCVFALIPFLLIFIASFLEHDEQNLIRWVPTLANYREVFSPLYVNIFWRSFLVALFTTVACLLMGYPFAFFISRLQTPHKSLLLLLVIIPLWTSSLIRSYAMIALLKAKGVINSLLLALGVISEPLQLLFTNTAVMIGLVYNLLPFMILPLYASLEKLDQRLVDAARDLGANRWQIIKNILLPLSKHGIVAGSVMVFLPSMTLFYIPNILGGAKSMLMGNLIQQQFLVEQNWPLGSATNILLTVLVALSILAYWRVQQQTGNKQNVPV